MVRRAVITGMGVLAPGSRDTAGFWRQITEGRTATRGITLFDPAPFRSRVAAEIDFDPAAHGLTARDQRHTGRAAQFALVAARAALADSGLGAAVPDPYRTGVVVGTAAGAVAGLDLAYRVMSHDGRSAELDPALAGAGLHADFVPASLAVEVAWAVGAEGPATVVTNGCTSGPDAVAHAAGLIADDSADVVVAGATDAPVTPIALAAFDALRAASTRNAEPETASRPFDVSRDGFVLGEGAAVFVVEELGRARRRGARPYAEVAGHAAHGNGFHMTGLRPDGRELALAVTAALDAARLNPEDVDYISAHGSGTPLNDRHETQAYKRALGAHARHVPISSIKSMVGHAMGSAGAIELAACLLAMAHHVVPPTANLTAPDPLCDLDYVPRHAREHRTDAVLTVSSGFGGLQSAMVLARPERSRP
ncbi:beta-ketoacyl-[acyl-carrier-protein] synthase family protein [Streptomyces sp. CSDS2]|uniref:beta-ketoacyl-[acyl-carrier-protein] synthase family protein n=1 Tax=Streptomyces sp. CSDS2 TaxID=3055051 RepID=UPI0025B1843E|nr:beta-ketoacyl-[acyl-carrier-protein] synthase family protein [Streptomyces sp. CSDS2]MDN3265712.1 beta-ketoacyl-[acyl-carrier-protein] synthase family protein [Streptomyces sp. CSDS2]